LPLVIVAHPRFYAITGLGLLLAMFLVACTPEGEVDRQQVTGSAKTDVAVPTSPTPQSMNEIAPLERVSELAEYKSETSDCITALAWLAISHRHDHTANPDPFGIVVNGSSPKLKKRFAVDSVTDVVNEYCAGLLNQELTEAFEME